jgi:transcriptional regulator with XRE-family HTH domain
MPVVVHIGNKLKETRTRELLTQQELAEKSGVGVNTIIRVERNQVEPHFRTIRKLAEALGIDPKALLWVFASWADQGAGQLVKIEKNKDEPRFSTILKLAETLKVEPSELVDHG